MTAARTNVVEIRADLLEALRELYPGRSDREILEGIVREYLSRCARAAKSDDEMMDALVTAPLDDEGTTKQEDHSSRAAIAEYHRKEATSSDQLKRELGLE